MAGLPVLVSEGNEQCRLTSDEGIGTCVDIDDPAAIAAACAELLSQPPEERRALRSHCREVALGKYTWDHTAVGLVELYRKLARESMQPATAHVRDGASPRGADA
jgi:glycosyltransferase involved in cell wall biosynthesis